MIRSRGVRCSRGERGSDGFTLVEILLVMVILGVLAAIVVLAVQDLGTPTARASCKIDFKSVETAVKAYRGQEQTYPPTIDSLAEPATDGQGPWIKEKPSTAHYTMSIDHVTGKVTVMAVGAPTGSAVAAGIAGCDAVS